MIIERLLLLLKDCNRLANQMNYDHCVEIDQDGMFLVDSPGIGETALATSQILNYLPIACSVIYVINAENAGGVQEDRVSLVQPLLLIISTTFYLI